MRKLLLLLLLLMPVIAFCTDKNSKKKLKSIQVSRWREVKRLNPDSSAVTIGLNDTLLVAFLAKDSFYYRNGPDGFLYTGGYTISDDSIMDFGTVRYRIWEKKPGSIVMSNTKGIYYLGPDLSDTAKITVLEKDEKIVPVTDIDQMIGKWVVYKRTSDGPTSVDMATQIRSAYITGPSSNGRMGVLYGGTDNDSNPSWVINSLGADQFLLCTGRSPRNFKVTKCQKGELIMEEQGITYYFKLK